MRGSRNCANLSPFKSFSVIVKLSRKEREVGNKSGKTIFEKCEETTNLKEIRIITNYDKFNAKKV